MDTSMIRYGRKTSGIKRDLKKKIGDWIDSITSPRVRELVARDTIVTGGSIASMLLGEKVNDYDIYFATKETALAVANYYVGLWQHLRDGKEVKVGENVSPVKMYVKEEKIENIRGEYEDRVVIFIKSVGVVGETDPETEVEYNYFENMSRDAMEEYVESNLEMRKATEEEEESDGKLRYRPVFISQNAITLSGKVQLITRFYGEPSKIHDNYDFVHAMSYYNYATNELVTPAEALECLLSRTLKYRGSLYPIASIFRTKKFIERGWRIGAGEMLKMMWQISEIDLTKMSVLREQLTGVDMAYLYEVISTLQETPEKINSTYVAAIIDKIFD